MQLEILPDPEAVARRAAALIAQHARAAVRARARFTLAVSGGRTPWRMLDLLTREDLPWRSVHVFQVDERVAPAGHADRNLTHIAAALQSSALPPAQLHAMPVEETDLSAAADRYAELLRWFSGAPPVLDLAHLGLGSDGHTASLLPGDPVLHVTDRDVALSGPYSGRRRMTLTYPVLNRARAVVWVVTGSDKAAALAGLQRGDQSIPAGRVARPAATVLADQAAAG